MSYRRGDHYTRRAKDAGYAARSVYKLEEIQKKWKVLSRGQRVIDLGCAPGSWSRFARECVGTNGSVLGVDLQEVGSFPGTFLCADIYTLSVSSMLEGLGGAADVLLSDMAPATMGNRYTDHVRQVQLAEQALVVAREIVSPGGAFVCKVFEGADAANFVQEVRLSFGTVKRLKPKATRGSSVEFFVVATQKKDGAS
ncbi:MAG: RlmE family RNA methyltransferase [Myxococcota bacterium]|nr:RlmE family RNA methyltransferase [Myxococcota bacterium]